MSDWSLPRAATCAAVVAVVALWTAIGHGQLSPAPRAQDDDPAGAVARDRSRASRSGSAARGTDREGCRSHSRQRRRHPALRSRIDHRQVQGRTRLAAASVQQRRKSRARSPTVRRRPTSTSWRFRPTPIRKAPRPRCAQRTDVEYAQPRYLNHAMVRPNDTLYSNQWNFPAIDMERAWDIQPGASSSIVVAVLDTRHGLSNGNSPL